MLRNQGPKVSHENEWKAGLTVCSALVQLPEKQKRHGSRDLEKLFFFNVYSSSSFACAVKEINLG